MTTLPPHLAAMQSLFDQIAAPATPPFTRKPFSCAACHDSGELSEGGPCNWCAAAGVEDDPDPTPAEEAAEAERLKAIQKKYWGF